MRASLARLLGWIVGIVAVQQQAQLISPAILASLLLGIALFGFLGGGLLLYLVRRSNCGANVASSKMRRVAWLTGWFLMATLAGYVYASWQAQRLLQEQLPAEWERQDLVVVGVVEGLPQAVQGLGEMRGVRFQLRVEQNEAQIENFPSRLSVGWYDRGAIDKIRPGQRWRFTVRLKQPHGNANPGGFDYERWLFEEGIRATGYVRNNPTPQRLHHDVGGFQTTLARWRQSLRSQMQQALLTTNGALPYSGVLVALVLGDQRAIAQDDWRLFNQTGIGHLVSISGLHVTMLAGLAATLVALIWRRWPAGLARLPAQKAAALAGVGVALLYCLLAGWGIPAQRTFYMLLVLAWALWRERLPQALPTMLCAAALVLTLDPLAALAPSLVLSFGAAGVLLWLAQQFMQPATTWRQHLGRATTMQLAISLALTPLTLAYFQQVSLVGPIANAVAIPLISFLITPLALLGTLCVSVFDWAAPLLGAHQLMAWLVDCLNWLATWSWASWSGAAPPLWATLLAVIGVVWFLLPLAWPWRQMGLSLLFPIFLVPSQRPAEGTWRMTALDVGQGTAVLIQTAHHALLYDTGPRYSAETDAAQRVLLPYLRHQGIHQLDVLVVSHRDQDHAGGLDTLWHSLPIKTFYTSLRPDEVGPSIAPHLQTCRDALPAWEWEGVQFRFIHPADPERYKKTNERSCVLQIRALRSRQSVLLTGDIPVNIESELVKQYGGALASSVLLVPHHGSASSSSRAFIQAVQPQWAIVQAGYRNQFQHPRPDVLARYAEEKVTVLETTRGGAWQFDFSEGTINSQAWRPNYCRYWQPHMNCMAVLDNRWLNK